MKSRKGYEKHVEYAPELFTPGRGKPDVWRVRVVGAGFFPISPYATKEEAQAKCDILNANPPKAEKDKPAPVNVSRKTSRRLRVDFTPDELSARANELAMELKTLGEIDADKKSAMAEFGARSKEHKARVERLTNEIASKHVMEDIDCEEYMNHPREGMKQMVRLDTMEVVDTRPMLPSDYQLTLADICNDNDGKTPSEKSVTEAPPENPDEADVEHGDGTDQE